MIELAVTPETMLSELWVRRVFSSSLSLQPAQS